MARLFGISIDPLSRHAAVERVISWLEAGDRGCKYVLTPNVNHVVIHQTNRAFQEAYRGASLVLADGRYILGASRLLGTPLPETVNGSDLVPALFEAVKSVGKLRVFLLGAMPGVAEQAGAKIEQEWPWIDVVGTHSPPMGFEEAAGESDHIISVINASDPDLLIIGISPPRQEIWICEHAARIDVKVAICAGATIDFLAGQKTRAPKWAQNIGAEWLFRIWTEPRRLLGRYVRDGMIFVPLVGRELVTRWRRQR